MYERIKALANEAIALQNKNRMEAALREISALASSGGVWIEPQPATEPQASNPLVSPDEYVAGMQRDMEPAKAKKGGRK